MIEPSKPGIRRCMKCRWFFVSQDTLRIGRCADCKRHEETYEPRTAKIAQVDGAVRHHFKEHP